jgi:hypothetical protein
MKKYVYSWWSKLNCIDKLDMLINTDLLDFYYSIGAGNFDKSGYVQTIFEKEVVHRLYKVVPLLPISNSCVFLVFPKGKKYKLNRRSLSHIREDYFLTITWCVNKPTSEQIRQSILNKKYELYWKTHIIKNETL